jgi:hypothetical protein
MAAFKLQSLVLRGSVLRDGLASGLRLGFGLNANTQVPGVRHSKRRPAPARCGPDMPGDVDPEVGTPTEGVTPGAGRSRRSSGSHARPQAAITRRLAGRALPGGCVSLPAAAPAAPGWRLPALRTPPVGGWRTQGR